MRACKRGKDIFLLLHGAIDCVLYRPAHVAVGSFMIYLALIAALVVSAVITALVDLIVKPV